jgi:hypothetical protein
MLQLSTIACKLGATVGSTRVLIGVDAAFNPDAVDTTKKCVFFDPVTGNMSATNNVNCDKVTGNIFLLVFAVFEIFSLKYYDKTLHRTSN